MVIRPIKILGTGLYVPEHKVTAQQLAQRLGVDEAWIKRKSGVETRYFAKDETASEMGAAAARNALTASDLCLDDIDCIVCTSAVPQQSIPCTAALIHQHLGGADSGIPAFDINASCLSFLTGLDTLSYLIAAGRYQRVLLIASEVAHRGLNWSDPKSCSLFGDGAAAVVIGHSSIGSSATAGLSDLPDSKILGSRMETYSRGAQLTECRGGGNLHSPYAYQENPESMLFSMEGKAIYRMAHEILPPFVERLLSPLGVTVSDMDMVIPHQASLMAMRLLRKHLGISTDRLMVIAQDYGNVIAASIPMALHEAIRQGKVKRGDRIMLLGTSAGFSVGGMVLDY